MSYHIPVLLEKAIEGLNIRSDGTYVDATFGGGGHAGEILKCLGAKGRLIAFDRDADAWAQAKRDERLVMVQESFEKMEEVLGNEKVDGILADLGVSSHQFDEAERGFSIRTDGPLDMRMDRRRSKTAAEVVNGYGEKELLQVLKEYGEIRNSRVVAGRLIKVRKEGRIETTGKLVEALENLAPPKKRNQFLAQVFQGLRIEVNDELYALECLLKASGNVLKPGGRLVVISYHSLEDRMVKNYIRTGNTGGTEVKDFYGNRIAPMKEVHRGPVVPDEEEINRNNRARSAKLRIAEKT